jgi:hypothetical protein
MLDDTPETPTILFLIHTSDSRRNSTRKLSRRIHT